MIASARVSSSPLSDRLALPIEEALRWAIRDELPKRRYDAPLSSMGSSISSIAVLGVRVDNWSREPGMPAAMGDAHPDSILIEEALRSLRSSELDLSGYDIGYRLGAHCNVERVIDTVRGRNDLLGRILHCAKQGKRPDLGEGPCCEAAKGTRGQVTLWIKTQREIGHGADGQPWYATHEETTTPVRAGQYREGTFTKLRWLRDADDIAEDRAAYALWHAALVRLVDILSSMSGTTALRYIKVKAPMAPATPWIAELPPARTLPSLVSNDNRIENPRVVALRPRARLASPVRHIDPVVGNLPAAA